MPRRRKHFRSNGIAAIVTAVAVVHLLAATAFADETSATSKPIAAPASKWQYNLFNPTPPDQMRGMDTDRPNFTNTPHTVDAGHLQIETGLFDYVNSFDHTGGTTLRGNDYAVGQFNFRLGVLNNLEMNVVINSYQLDQTRDEVSRASTRVDGFGDTFFGGKLNLWGNEGGDEVWATGLAIQPQFKFSTARSALGNRHFEFAVGAPLLVNLPNGFHLGWMPSGLYERNSTNTGYVAGLQNSVALDRVFSGIDLYIEYAASVSTEKHVKAIQTLDVGGTYPLNDNVVLDTGFNFGLNKDSNKVEALVGISVRL